MIISTMLVAALAAQPALTPGPVATPAPVAAKKMACCEEMAKGEGCSCCKGMAKTDHVGEAGKDAAPSGEHSH